MEKLEIMEQRARETESRFDLRIRQVESSKVARRTEDV